MKLLALSATCIEINTYAAGQIELPLLKVELILFNKQLIYFIENQSKKFYEL